MRTAAKSLAGIVAVSAASLGLFALVAETNPKYPTCKAASEDVDYGTGLSIPEDTRVLIESYRADWRNLCAPKGTAKPSLANIFDKAKQIEADFKKIFEAFNASIINEASIDFRRLTAINDLVSNRYPKFVPGFEGAYGEHEDFSPAIEAFRQSAPLGTDEDRVFFKNQISLDGDFPPFIMKTWDYGGCDRYGEFDWTSTLKGIARVKKNVKHAAYLKESSILEESLFRELGAKFDICTCGKKEAVSKDLLRVQKYLRKEPAYALQVPKIQQTIDSIQSGKIQVRSEAEKHCSGG
jgi:hypothetical protein